ncbi:MAG: RNA polymerase sigma factor FliA [Paraperlucidibaca sp.]
MSGHVTYQSVAMGSRDELVMRHAGLVKKIACHLAGRMPANVEVDDLIQAGMMGLLEAASHFQQGKGASFETFAAIRIRGAMLDQVRREGWAPRTLTKRVRDMGQAVRRVEHRKGREATGAEVASEMGVSLDEYHDLLRDAGSLRVFSLDQLSEDGFDAPADDGTDKPLGALLEAGFTEALAEQIAGLPEREKMVLALYYERGLNLKEIGEVLEVSESRVSQIHSQAVLRLRSRLGEWTEVAA